MVEEAKARRRGIELLPVITPTGLSKLVSFWARSVGIPLLSLLVLLFLSLFAFRLKLEWDLRSLQASIAEKEAVLTEAAGFEESFRAAQTKLAAIEQAREELCFSCAIGMLYELKPALVNFTTLSLQGTELNLSAETPQGASFALLVSRIIEEKSIQAAAITSTTLSREGKFSFTMELVLDKEKLKR